MDLLFIHFYWKGILLFFSCSVSHVWLFVSPWTAAYQASLSIIDPQGLLKFRSIKSVMPSNLCHPLSPPSPAPVFPSIRVFFGESALHIRWRKDWSFCFSISHSSEYSGLISFRIYWFDVLAVQGTLKSLLQHNCLMKHINILKICIVQWPTFFKWPVHDVTERISAKFKINL